MVRIDFVLRVQFYLPSEFKKPKTKQRAKCVETNGTKRQANAWVADDQVECDVHCVCNLHCCIQSHVRHVNIEWIFFINKISIAYGCIDASTEKRNEMKLCPQLKMPCKRVIRFAGVGRLAIEAKQQEMTDENRTTEIRQINVETVDSLQSTSTSESINQLNL